MDHALPLLGELIQIDVEDPQGGYRVDAAIERLIPCADLDPRPRGKTLVIPRDRLFRRELLEKFGAVMKWKVQVPWPRILNPKTAEEQIFCRIRADREQLDFAEVVDARPAYDGAARLDFPFFLGTSM